jgi:hypothetical protein
MKKLAGSTAGRVVALAIVLAMCLFSAQAATATSQSSTAPGATERKVAQTNKGALHSRIVGTTGNGRKVTGSFVPLRFARHDGKVYVRGLIQGVVHERDGDRTTFAKLKTIRVKSVNGTPARAGRVAPARATCDILHLVLGPLDLNLLGLKVHLDRIVLNVVAESGAGNLLGNLLCAVTGLLDGGLAGQLGILTNLLNRILGLLRLG